MKSNYTWSDVCEWAVNSAFLSYELKAKDEARYQLRELILSETGVDIEKCECPEKEIEDFLAKRDEPVWFDKGGNIIET